MWIKYFKPFLLLIALVACLKSANATHIMGGEITWECLDNGQYIFTIKIYRDCNGIGFDEDGHELEIHNYPSPGLFATKIPLDFFSVTDITPSCEGSPCATLQTSDPDIPGAIEEYILKSDSTTLSGVPGPAGWIFTWTYGDRNAAIDNIIDAQDYGITLRAKMFNYQGQNANLCFDSSPDFFQKPSSIICGGEKFTYNHSAFDNELDSLSYSWAEPLDGGYCDPPPCYIGSLFEEGTNPILVPFDIANGYSYDSPYPDTNLDNQNIPAVLDPITGEITFTSFTTGEFVSVIRVDAYKCGIKVAEVYRELQTVITINCAANEPPEIPSPFTHGNFSDTVKVGEKFQFDIEVLDSLRADNPKDDSIFFYASGIQFGSNFTDSATGCLNPPCATLTNPAPDTGIGSYITEFNWQTTCDHLAINTPTCVTSENTYIFVVRAFDDFCPAAGQSIATFSLTVLAKELVPHPDIHCADVQPNGDVAIDWNLTTDIDSSFIQWKIYSSTDIDGPYTLIDSIQDYDSTNYTHSGAGANDQSIHYIVRAESGCNTDWTLTETDTISTQFASTVMQNTCIFIDWNELDLPLPDGSGATYDVYREYPIGSGFSLYKTTSISELCDTFNVCTDTVAYRIFLSNTGNGCSGSSSNITGIRFLYPILPADAGSDINICDGQSTVIGGSPSGPDGVVYTWEPNAFITDSTLANPLVNPSTDTRYYLTITDSNSCTDIDSVDVLVQPTPIANAGVNDTICSENFPIILDGAVSVSNEGRWIGGTGTFSPDRNTLTATYQPSATEASNGTVSLELVSDNIGICDPDTDQVTFTIPPFIANYTLNLKNVSCNGFDDGTAKINVIGVNTPYSYTWSTNNGVIIGDTVSNLSPGNFSLTVTNKFNCDSVITFNISEPTVLASSTSVQSDVSCNGFSDASAFITPSGGTPPYSYLWSDNQTADTATALSAQKYFVTLTDDNGCTKLDSVSIAEPTVLSIATIDSLNASCFGFADGKAWVVPSGGTAPYSYLWSDNQTTDSALGLVAGNYSVTVTDDNNCTIIASTVVNEPTVLASSTSVQSDVSCNGFSDASAFITPSGGTPPYSYLWSDNQTADTATALSAQKYFVTLTDDNGCTKLDSVSIAEPTVLSIATIDSLNASCFGFADGMAWVVPSGGTAPYSYLWSDNQTTDSALGLVAGNYSVTVTDDNNCTIIASTGIDQADSLRANLSSIQISCFNYRDGRIDSKPTGGIAPYNFRWSNNERTISILNLAKGFYTLSITDQDECTTIDSIEIVEPEEMTLSVTNDDTICVNIPKILTASGSGGTGSLIYTWNNNLGNNPTISVSPQSNAEYKVQLTDQNNCPAKEETVMLSVRNIIDDSLTLNSSGDICRTDSSILSYIHIGDYQPYDYDFNQGLSDQNPQTVRPNLSTTYILTVTDICNNQITDEVTVLVSQPPPINLFDTLIEKCVTFEETFTNKTPANYTYEWDLGNGTTSFESNPTILYDQEGLFMVKLKVATPEGCESTFDGEYLIRAFPSPIATINASPLIANIDNPTITFFDDFSSATDWLWYFGNDEESILTNPSVTYGDTGTYLVSLWKMNQYNCIDTAYQRIIIEPNFEIKIPNAFTPNPNGSNGGIVNPNSFSNEVFHPFIEYTKEYHLMIFNRWGELIFESKDVNIGWDGYYKNNLSQSDVYVYKLEVTFVNGEKATKVGDITLLR